LAIISASSYSLRRALKIGDAKVTEEALTSIDDATDRAARIVRGLGKFSRQAGDDPPEKLEVAGIVADALSLCRARAAELGVKVINEGSSGARVEGHPVELSQVLVNLLNNASAAAQAAAERWVRVSVLDADDGWVSIVVENSGEPIAAAVAPRIFQAFFTTKRVGEGTGLGLSISRGIVEAHGGTLNYEPGGPHTRFIIRLRSAR
jgi:signal transduction histidine kinase